MQAVYALLDGIRHSSGESNVNKFAVLIVKHSKTYGVSPYTILAMIQVETGTTCTHGDTGLLQVLPATTEIYED